MLKLLTLCISHRNLEQKFIATVQGSEKKKRKKHTQIHFQFSFLFGFFLIPLSTAEVLFRTLVLGLITP